MTREIFRSGQLVISECASVCDVCEHSRIGLRIAGPHGHVNTCYQCVIDMKWKIAGLSVRAAVVKGK